MPVPRGKQNQMDNWNYFHYFTEIEEHFWKKRGAHLLVSPLDWAIMEAWQKAGVPLEAAEESQEAAAGAQRAGRGTKNKEAFSREEVQAFLQRNVEMVKKAEERCAGAPAAVKGMLSEVASSLSGAMVLLEAPGRVDLEDLERRLTVMDDKVHATLLSAASEELLLKLRREMDSQLAAYRKKMKAEQLALVEKQYLQKRLLEEYRMPRLSLFYLM